ncbi:hypothetical protein CVO77_00395 [Sphingopyxis lindanitolerans]|uniref:Uncharacterized protein n=1 Tax=Sphingopyxis lindanitolerans TaxID=2054227 RepID=A0A2S8BAI6_9SPHN|nr:hypothetical protein [Sphingopyxis lindanitolerans]PQM29432.1 hypothetical protein CVO77_00395 [Sphingopyxis lindanitolerans]
MTGDLASTIVPKSDQLNADDLIAGPITITVRDAYVRKGEDQPCYIFYEGDNGKPYKPNKGQRRLLMLVWKTDESKDFIGRSMTLFRNPDVLWAGKPEGGIQVSHVSHITEAQTHMITVRRGLRVAMTVKPLAIDNQRGDNGAREVADDLIRRAEAAPDVEALAALAEVPGIIKRREWLRDTDPALYDKVGEAFEARERELTPADTATPDNPTAAEGPADDDRGDQFDGTDEAPAWRKAVDDHLDAIRAAETVLDLKSAINRFEQHREFLSADALAEVEAAENDRAGRLNPLAGG